MYVSMRSLVFRIIQLKYEMENGEFLFPVDETTPVNVESVDFGKHEGHFSYISRFEAPTTVPTDTFSKARNLRFCVSELYIRK